MPARNAVHHRNQEPEAAPDWLTELTIDLDAVTNEANGICPSLEVLSVSDLRLSPEVLAGFLSSRLNTGLKSVFLQSRNILTLEELSGMESLVSSFASNVDASTAPSFMTILHIFAPD